VQTESKSPLRPSLRGWLRPSLRLWFRALIASKGSQSPCQRRLRAWRFADIPIRPPIQNTRDVIVIPWTFSASLALDACAITSALAPQRFSDSTAAITLRALASQRFPISLAVALLIFAFAVLTRLAVARRVWGSA